MRACGESVSFSGYAVLVFLLVSYVHVISRTLVASQSQRTFEEPSRSNSRPYPRIGVL